MATFSHGRPRSVADCRACDWGPGPTATTTLFSVPLEPSLSPLCFGPYRLAGERGPLWRGAEEVPLRRKTLEVLWHLVEHRGQVVDQDLLLARVWPKRVVSPGTLAVSIAELRRALEDNPRTPRYIQTAHRRGYRFVAPVHALVAEDAATAPVEAPLLLGREAELR